MRKIFTFSFVLCIVLAFATVCLNAEEPAQKQADPPKPAEEQKPADNQTPAPEKAPEKAPEQAPEKAPDPAPEKAPEKAPEQTPAQNPAPAQNSTPAPAQTSTTAPKPASTPAPAQTSTPTPAASQTSAQTPSKKEWKTFELKSVPLRVNVEATGIVWAEDITPIKLSPKTTSSTQSSPLSFKVESAVKHGTTVKAGDVLVKFKKDDYDAMLLDQTLDFQLAEIAYKRAKLSQKTADVNFAITSKLVNRKKADRLTKWEFTQKYDVGFSRRRLELSFESATQTYENQKAELEQLSRMYKAEELNEQSEEIVLQRQRMAFKLAQYDFDLAKARNEWTHRMLIPRIEEDYKDTFDKEMAAIEQEVAELELTRKATEIERKKLDIQFQKTVKKYNELKADGQLFELKAPKDGIVLYGSLENGTWVNYAKSVSYLQSGTEVPKETVFMTIVNPEKVFVKLTVPESSYSKIAIRQKGWFVATSWPDVEIPAEVTALDSVISEGGYQATASIDLPPGMQLVPGLKGKMMIAAVRKSTALLVPATAVDRGDDLQRFVYVLDEAKNEPVKKPVKIGIKTGEKLEILDGVSAGMKILEDPKSVE